MQSRIFGSHMMSDSTGELYEVVVNGEGQYSIWRSDRVAPDGWEADGCTGAMDACLAHIAAHWVDMRPARVRSAIGARAEEPRL